MSDCVTLSCQFNVVVLESHFPRFACSHSALHTDYHDTLCGLDALRFAGISIHCFCALFVITRIAAMHVYAVHFHFSRVWGAILSSCSQVLRDSFWWGLCEEGSFWRKAAPSSASACGCLPDGSLVSAAGPKGKGLPDFRKLGPPML